MTQGFELFAKIGGDASGLQRALGNAQKAVGGAGQAMERLRRVGVRALQAVGVAAGTATVALVAFARSGLRAVDEQAKLARSVDGTINGLRALQLAASDAGVESGQLGASMQMLNARLAEAARGTGTAAATMERLGLSASELLNLDIDDRMAVIADRMRELRFTSAQAQDALAQLGIRNRQLALLFTQGGDAIRDARNEVRDFGLEISQVDARQVEIANDAFSRVGLVVEGVRQQLAIELSSALLGVSQAFTDVVKEAGGLDVAVRQAVDSSVRFIAGMVNAFHRVRMEVVRLQIDILVMMERVKVAFDWRTLLRPTFLTLRRVREEVAETSLTVMQLRSELLDMMGRSPGDDLIQAIEEARRKIEEAAEAAEEAARRTNSSFRTMVNTQITALLNLGQTSKETAETMTGAFGDSIQKLLDRTREMSDRLRRLFKTNEELAFEAARNMQNAMADFFFDPFNDGLKGMLKNFVDMLRRMVAELMARAALMAFLSSVSGGGGPLAAFANILLGSGRRERGGPVMSRQPYMVGERGPEMFVPHGAGRVVPNNQLVRDGGTMVTVNINAEDPGAEGRIRTMVERELAPQIVQAAVGQTFGRLQRPRFA